MDSTALREIAPDGHEARELLELSAQWEAENSCYGYRRNGPSDLAGRRIFGAFEDGALTGYLLGAVEKSQRMRSIMPENTPCFEVEELYVRPERRSAGIGSALFRYAQEQVGHEAAYITLSAVSKNYWALLRFYVEELGMELWSARLFKRL